MDENPNNQKTASQKYPSSTDTLPASGTKDIAWQLPAIFCFLFGIISCLPLANSLFHLGIDNSFLLLLLGIIPSGLIAVIIGFASLKLLHENQKSRKFIITGIALGLTALISTPLMFPSYREDLRKFSCASNLTCFGLALRMYSQEFKEYFPDENGAKGLEMLRSGGYLENINLYTCPSAPGISLKAGSEITEEITNYVYVGGLKESDPVDTPIMYDKPSNHISGYRNVLFIDGNVGKGSGSDWLEEAKTNVYHKIPVMTWTKRKKANPVK